MEDYSNGYDSEYGAGEQRPMGGASWTQGAGELLGSTGGALLNYFAKKDDNDLARDISKQPTYGQGFNQPVRSGSYMAQSSYRGGGMDMQTMLLIGGAVLAVVLLMKR